MSILIIGDLMLDDYRLVEVNRVSPEAPCLIGLDNDRKVVLGGAANVAANIRKLTNNLLLIGKGEVEAFKDLFAQFDIKYHLFHQAQGHSIKMRFIDTRSNVQLFRYDIEKDTTIDLSSYSVFVNGIDFSKYNVCVIVDYMKGMIRSERTLSGCGINIVSTKNPDASSILPKQANESINILIVNNLEYDRLRNISGYDYLIRTEGSRGMSIFRVIGSMLTMLTHIDGIKVDVFDVTGAGDTVTAIISYCMDTFGFSESNLINACKCANNSAAQVVTRSGTTCLSDTPEQIKTFFS